MTTHANDDALKLEEELSFSLYACSKALIHAYKPHLDALNLTYTQYLAMTVLWEFGQTNSRVMGRMLYLDSGTLTPVLKALEQKGFIRRDRGEQDKRQLIVNLTEKGYDLKAEAAHIPGAVAARIGLSESEAQTLHTLLGQTLSSLSGTHA